MMRWREKNLQADRKFLIAIFVLVVFGLVALTSASSPVGYEKFGDTYFYLKRQVLYGLLPGLLLFWLLIKIDYTKWQKFSWFIYAFSIVLLVLVFIPGIGNVINGSKSWINIGGYSFQPAEFAKLAIIIMAARLLSDKERDKSNWQFGLLPILAILAPAFGLILIQPDIGTLSIIVVILFAMLYVAQVPKKFLAVLGGLGVVVFIGLMLSAPYRMQRLTVFLHPELDPKGIGYHMNQAFLAIGSGGFWGFGLGHSRQKFQYLPEVSSDSIYAIIAEENGFLISAGLLILILIISWRGLFIAKSAPDDFGRLLVTGIMVWLAWQSFLNIGAMVGVLPLTGVPLPFVSHGGSALMTELAAVGIVAGVSRR